jgi:hypothetical protein
VPVDQLSNGPNGNTKLTGPGGMLDMVASNGGWLNLVFHEIVTGAPGNPAEILQTDFDMTMDAIAARVIPVIPVRDVVRRAGV